MHETSTRAETRVLHEGVSWDAYVALLEAEESGRGRISYEEGRLEIMTPSYGHEFVKGSIGCLIEAYAQEFDIDIAIAGAVTLKRKLARRGLEPDESYYVQNELAMRGRREVDLDRGEEGGPPPDLAIEIQFTRSALDKLGIYAALGVPEVWLWDKDRLVVHWLEDPSAARGIDAYARHDSSRALPGLPIDALLRFAGELETKSLTRVAKEFRAWLRERAEGAAGG